MSAKFKIFSLACFILLEFIYLTSINADFDFKRQLFEEPTTLFLWIVNIDKDTGKVDINGVDTQGPGTPFTWDWGDGVAHDGWFPQNHTYSNITKNYIVKVTAHYSGDKTDFAEILVRFVAPNIVPISLPDNIAVSIPDHDVALTSRMPGYGIPDGLTHFDDDSFDTVSRSDVEYLLSLAAWLQMDFVNDNVYLIDGNFNQVLLRDPTFGGMYSLWYTSPVSFGVGDYGFQGTIQYSSFMHEMGHNFTLNSPANYYYGGKTDGNASTIFSETMAQIFQHATAYEIVNNFDTYGLSEDIAFDIEQNAIPSISLVRISYENYVNSGMAFSSWNDPSTPEDETFNTFMAIAYKFFAHAENDGFGYKIPLKRMMTLLQLFDPDLRQRYDQQNNNLAADTFRATLMVTALSYAFSTDLRGEFRNLNFPISDETYSELMDKVGETQEQKFEMKPGWNLVSFWASKCFYQGTAPAGQPACVKLVDIQQSPGLTSLADWLNSVIKPANAWRMVIGAGGAMDSILPPEFHSLKSMSPCSGYWIKINENLEKATMTIKGAVFPPGCAITLKEGWNLVGYPISKGYYDTAHPEIPWITDWKNVDAPVADHVFSSIAGKYSMIIGENGAYNPSLSSSSSNTLHYIACGHGYWIKMKEAANLIYSQ